MQRQRRTTILVAAGLAVAGLVAVSSAWLASGDPDGLERVAEDKAFADRTEDPGYTILPDYTIPGIENETLSTAVAGVVGVLVIAGLVLGAGYVLRRRERADRDDAGARGA